MKDAQNQLTAALQSTSCKAVKHDGEWYFSFENEAVLRARCLWRLVVGGRVVLSSRDHGQMFGLKSPVDAAHEATRILADKEITEVAIESGKADLHILLSDGTELELLNDSSGFEPWGFSSKQLTLVATADGDIFRT